MAKGCLRTLSIVAAIAALGMLAFRCACMRTYVDGDDVPPAEARGPFAVSGIPLGTTESACRALLPGEPETLRGPPGTTTLAWRTGNDVTITFDAQGAREISGGHLTDLAGNVVAGPGTGLTRLRALFPRAEVAELTRPTGNGVISLSRTLLGTSLTWRDATGGWTIGCGPDGRLRSVRATR